MVDDLKIIKKKYNEAMMHLCREMFQTILEEPGLLSKIMLEHFTPNRFLYRDIVENHLEESFKNYIYSFIYKQDVRLQTDVKHPKELLKDAGYVLYECLSEDDIQKFKKFYASKEAICTFKGNRLDRCYVFFAVKENADKLRREDFISPARQDEYGTSVISIQFTRDDSHTLSIKNRYNHSVRNPDATFSNNLDNIIPGLTDSFEKYYNLKQKLRNSGFEIPGYVLAKDGKYYKYNYEINNIYYCPNNVIIDNFEVKKFPKEQFVIFDYFVLDLKNKTVFLYDKNMIDSFPETIGNILKVCMQNIDGGHKKIELLVDSGENIIIVVDDKNQIISYVNNNIKEIGGNFLVKNKELKYLEVKKLEDVKNLFLYNNINLDILNAPNLQVVGYDFLHSNKCLKELILPSLKQVGAGFLHLNTGMSNFVAPNLEIVSNDFLKHNIELTTLDFPNLKLVGCDFLNFNQKLNSINVPRLEIVVDGFLKRNLLLKELNVPYLQKVGDSFLRSNVSLEVLNAHNLKEVGKYFLASNGELLVIDVPIEILDKVNKRNDGIRRKM